MKWFFSFCLFFNLKNFTGNRNSKTRKGKARAARGRRPGISWRNVLPEEGCPCERERERENGAKSERGGQERDVVGKKKEQVGGVARAVRGHGGGEAVGPTWSWRVTEVADPRLGSGLGISFFKGEVSVSIGRDAAAPWQKVNQPPPDSVGLGSPIIPWL